MTGRELSTRPRVVIVGAGFAGLNAAKNLDDAPVDVVVVDQRNHHTFQPLLYQVATAGLDVDDICYATRGVFQRQTNARAVQARITGVDFDEKRLTTADGPPIDYDILVLALGAITADFGIDGVNEHAFGLKSGADALSLRNHVLSQFEMAERSTDDQLRRAAMTIVVVGAGPTGVEMAGGFAELVHRVLHRDFPGLDTGLARIVLVEGLDQVLGTFDPRLQAKAMQKLESMGVEVRLETFVDSVEADLVRFRDGTTIATNTVVWAAGVRAHPLAEAMGLETDRSGRVAVDDHLRAVGHPGVYVIGDLAAATGDDGEPLPQVAAVAIQAGEHVADVLAAELENEALPDPFRYRDKGSMATIGRNAAVVELPWGPNFSGFFGWIAWLGLHLVMLIGFRNRANVLVNWAWNYLTYDRASRLIIELDDVARRGLPSAE